MANELLRRLAEERDRQGNMTKLARRLDLSPQVVQKTLTGTSPVRWEMACAIWARLPHLAPDLLLYMGDHWKEVHRGHEATRNDDIVPD